MKKLKYFSSGLLLIASLLSLNLSYAQTMNGIVRELKNLLPSEQAGIAITLVSPEGEDIRLLGNKRFDEDSLFEYGSITKVFTAITLAQLSQEGSLDLKDSINTYLPEASQDKKWEQVSFQSLATHSSGLSRLPSNMNILYLLRNTKDPYQNYDKELLLKALQKAKLNPPSEYNVYSNYGFGLLGELLADSTNETYQNLIQNRIFTELEMHTATMSGWASDNTAPPLGGRGGESSYWNFDALAGAGAARGSIKDALKFLKASMTACNDNTSLSQANCQAQQATGVRAGEKLAQGLGWIRFESDTGDIIWHNGGTGGFSSFLGFHTKKQLGIILLANAADVNLTNIALEFLTSPD